MRRRVLLPAAAVAAGLAAAVVAWPGGAEVRLRSDDPEVVAAGAAIYAAQCAACHGAELEGQPGWRGKGPDGRLPAPPHDETGHTWHHGDEVLFRLTKEGPKAFAGPDYQTAMPGFAGVLSDAEILAVLSYIKAQWPEPIRQRHDQANAQGG